MLATKGVVVGETTFGPGHLQKLVYSLEAREGIEGLGAEFVGHKITVFIPSTDAKAWPGNERVGFEQTVQATPESGLHLLVEKDFVCMDESVEDQSDHYANPKA